MAFDLASLRRGKDQQPPRVVLYGEHGLGKSTFAACAPSPVFIPTEDGLGNIDTTSFPLCKTYADMMDALGALYEQPHDFQTVCLDSLDWAEQLVWSHTCAKHDHANIEDFGYGKGYIHAADQFRALLAGFDALRRDRGMAVILTAHCQVKRFDSPTSEPYDRYKLKLHKHAAAVVQEWADVVAFVAMEAMIKKEDVGFQKKAARAITTGNRVMHLNLTPSYDAKNRYRMPDTLPLSWDSFQAALTDQSSNNGE